MAGYFYGWYFKCQSDIQTLAVIPAVHGAGRERTCSIQFITDEQAWSIINPIGKMHFGKTGIQLQLDTQQLKVKGDLNFSNPLPLKYDIMGPFRWVPCMECRHSVYSMQHSVDGKISLNGKEYEFDHALGYWEGDSGRSFPKEYLWTQSFLEDANSRTYGSIMLSVADIPLAGFHFTGIIGIVYWQGKEYRFATYLGARAVHKEKERILIRQGNLELEVRLLEKNAQPLQAPIHGAMSRVIRENVNCRAFYRFRKNGQTVFAVETKRASFEYEYES